MAIEQKPYGVTLKPRRSLPTEEAELEREVAELQEIEVKRLRNIERHRDPIGEVFDGKICRRNHSFWFIQYRWMPVTVSHYYPDKNVALDVFQTIGPDERREIAFKREAFKAEGIRYAALDYSMDVADILPQITKKLWPFGGK
jgi:hypothetical protein